MAVMDLEKFHASLAALHRKLDEQREPRFITAFERGQLLVELYKPVIVDNQIPHTRDELYIIVQGTGEFECNGEKVRFNPGDLLFAPAHAEHRFTDFGENMIAWVIFYGPEGGEQV